MADIKTDIYQTSAIIIPDPEIEEFSWTFLVSPRSKIQKNIESVSFGGFNFNGLQFRTGFLADADHKWGLSLYSNQINTFMSLPKRDLHHRYTVNDSKLELISKDCVMHTHPLSFQRDETVAAPRMLWTSFWVNTDQSWDDSIDKIRITFNVGRESRRSLHTLVSQQTADRNRGILEAGKDFSCKDFFLSSQLSDVVLQCKDQEFPAHRIILSFRSSVFSCMFRSGMKENEDGRVVIEDMEPEVLKELLRYIYCNEVSPEIMGTLCSELFEASDRFDLQPLKVLCEAEMIKRVDVDNALQFYMQAELHDARLLKEKSFDVIRQNKKFVFSDRDTFKVFATRYTDIAYELFSCFA